jgi:WhiB family redox-sensing transcriptional regulator
MRHGTFDGYNIHKCRCPECCETVRIANRDRQARYRARKRAEMQAPDRPSRRPDPWPERAACKTASPSIFFPRGEDGATQPDYSHAKAICATCVVRGECLAAGLYERFGVWGGTTPRQRRGMRKSDRRAIMPVPPPNERTNG